MPTPHLRPSSRRTALIPTLTKAPHSLGKRRAHLPRLCGGLLAVALGVAVGGCGQGGTAGTALRFPSRIWVGMRVMPPGAKFGLLGLDIPNKSNAPLTIDSIRLDGPGMGTVARVVQTAIAPPTTVRHSVPASTYVSDPPVAWVPPPGGRIYRPGCYVQALRPVHGYVVPPGGIFRVWVVIQLIRPGRWRVANHTVYYTQYGARYHQVITLSYSGTVAAKAAWPQPDNEGPCLARSRHTLTRPLDPGHTRLPQG
jgi:hypothetical protein